MAKQRKAKRPKAPRRPEELEGGHAPGCPADPCRCGQGGRWGIGDPSQEPRQV